MRAILPNERHHRILLLLAQGFRDAEIAEQVGMTPRSVEWTIQDLAKRFYSLNRPNLVAIIIALGIINPNDFIPGIGEPQRAVS